MLKFIREMDAQVTDGEDCESEDTGFLEDKESTVPPMPILMPVIEDKHGQLRLF